MRAHDWTVSPLGDPQIWPQSLRALVRVMLNAQQPMFIAWGPELAFLYNDAYAPIFGAKHPDALGRPFAEVWSDIWSQIKPLVDNTLAGRPSWHEDLLIPMQRHGYLEDAWFSFSYTPAWDENDRIAGMFCAATETTEKVLAERRNVAERQLLQQMFEQAPGIMVMLRGRDHIFELANHAYLQLVGHRDLIGKTVREVLPELEGQGFFELLDNVHRTGEPFVGRGVPVRVQREPGGPLQERFVDFIYQPIKNADGRVTGIFVEGYDITDAKQSVEALRASEEFNRRILDSSSDCIKVLDSDARLQFMSQGGMQVMEVDDFGVIQGCDWRSFWSGPEHEKARQAVEIALAGGTARFQGPTPTAKGTPKWWDVAVTPIRGADGEVEKLLSVSRDITAAKEAEEALRQSQRRLNAVLNNASVSIFLMDDQQHCVYMNAAAEKLTGYTLAEVTGRPLHDVIHHTHPDGSHFPLEDCPIDRAFPEEHQVQGEEVFVHKDGSFYPVAFTASPIHNEEAKAIGTIIEVRDISAEKKAQEHQRLLINELNHRVKNTLATVQSITSQTLRNAATAQSAKDALEGRLLALSRTHDVLTRENWESAELREIVAQAVEPYRGQGEDRFHLEGTWVRLPPRMALALAMALQELATNAVKYGALSNATGTIRITWRIDGLQSPARLHLRWEESGGPAVVAPTRRGFGTRLIERSLAQDLDGEVQIEFAPTGVVCTVNALIA
ncbi:PAS domain-containing protein [Microvirga arabica]|uniref:Blue-light-activated histidine kinase n=2 Tax=Microvirga arabica TaxID=1128671 RepID=A0ABV6Y1J4_9HYPH